MVGWFLGPLVRWFVGCLVSYAGAWCLIDLLFGRLAGWLAGRLISWLASGPVAPSMNRSLASDDVFRKEVGWLIGWLLVWWADWLVGSSGSCFVAQKLGIVGDCSPEGTAKKGPLAAENSYFDGRGATTRKVEAGRQEEDLNSAEQRGASEPLER